MATTEKINSFPASRDSVKKVYYAPIKHNTQRRKKDHDYTSVSLYLITVTTVDRQKILGNMVGNSAEEAHIEPTDLGRMVIAFFKQIPEITLEKTGCHVQVVQYQLMPDHFHGILYVKDKLPKEYPLGQIISGWKGACTRAYNSPSMFSSPASRDSVEVSSIFSSPARRDSVEVSSIFSSPASRDSVEVSSIFSSPASRDSVKVSTFISSPARRDSVEVSSIFSSPASRDSAKKPPLFNPGYNDRVLNQFGQLEGWIEYLRDNPRRLWLKVHNADRLRKVYEFTAGKQGHRYTAVGETFFVKYPERAQVRCHRNLNEEEIQHEVAYYLGLAHKGVVLVSPFISPAEKAVYDACFKEKLKMIRIVNRGLDNRFVYPSGRDLQGCSDGFMLVLAPYTENSDETRAVKISRATCLDMNGYAADLATFTLSREAENEITQNDNPNS